MRNEEFQGILLSSFYIFYKKSNYALDKNQEIFLFFIRLNVSGDIFRVYDCKRCKSNYQQRYTHHHRAQFIEFKIKYQHLTEIVNTNT